jgi:hypothetical protein
MPTVTVTRADVTRDEAIHVVSQQLGDAYTVKPGNRDDMFSVTKGVMTGAKVHIRPHDGATQFHVHGTGIIIGRLLNELGIARRVATAISQGLG